MPFAPVSNPDLAGEFMARGISSAGTGLATGLQRALEGMNAKKKERKTYLGLADALNSQGLVDDHTRAALENADTDTIKGTVDGLITAQTLKHVGFNNDLLKQHLDAANTERTQMSGLNAALARATGANDNPALGDFYESPENYPNGRPAGTLDADTLLRASAQSGLIGNPNLDKFMAAMERVQARQAETRDFAKPEFTDVPGSDSVLVRLGKSIQVVPRNSAAFQPAIDAKTGEVVPGAYSVNGRVVQVPQASEAGQQNADTRTVQDAEAQLQALDKAIGNWHTAQLLNKEDPKRVPAPDPAKLAEWQRRRAIHQKIFDAAAARLTPDEQPSEAKPKATRSTDIEPPIGTVREGKGGISYRYIGGYGPRDKRSWQAVGSP